MLLLLSILSSLFLAVLADYPNAKRHSALVQRKRNELTLAPRWPSSFTGARATWYQTGLGGCGIWNNPDDYIVALNFPMFGYVYPGPMCFKKIMIEYQGKTAVAQITDACEVCPAYGGIDMSEGLFRHFADPANGVIQVNWWFTDGGDDSPPAPKPKPKPTTSKWVAPTPKWTPPTKTHHSTHTSSSHWTPSSKAWTSIHRSSSTPTSSSVPPIATPAGVNNIANLYQALLGVGNAVIGGATD